MFQWFLLCLLILLGVGKMVFAWRMLCVVLGCFGSLALWLVGWLVRWLVGWLVGWLAWLVGWLVGWLAWVVGWLVGLFGWLLGLFDCLIAWLVTHWLVRCLLFILGCELWVVAYLGSTKRQNIVPSSFLLGLYLARTYCLNRPLRPQPLQVSSSKLHLAGTPCTDYSVKGEQLRQAGLTFILFLCWVAQRLLLQEDIIVQENVPQFPVEVLYRFFHKLYHVETAIISPYDYGWGVQRRRRWTVMRHKYKTTAFTSPLNLFSALFNAPPWFGEWSRLGHNERTPAWDIFFAASWKEIVDELVWAFGRPESQWKGSFSETELLSRDFKGVDFLPALTTTEQGHLVDYISASAPGNEYQVFSLNQNPLHVDTRSSWSNLQTLIKNAGVMW